jgi:hypothetical protein
LKWCSFPIVASTRTPISDSNVTPLDHSDLFPHSGRPSTTPVVYWRCILCIKTTQTVYEFEASRPRRVRILNPNDIHDCTKRNLNSNVNIQPQLCNTNSIKKQKTLPENSEGVLMCRLHKTENFITKRSSYMRQCSRNLWAMLPNGNCNQGEIKNRPNLAIACYVS